MYVRKLGQSNLRIDASRRGKNELPYSHDKKKKTRTVGGRKSLLCDPGNEYQVTRKEKGGSRSAKIEDVTCERSITQLVKMSFGEISDFTAPTYEVCGKFFNRRDEQEASNECNDTALRVTSRPSAKRLLSLAAVKQSQRYTCEV